jgi:hypothetical protein
MVSQAASEIVTNGPTSRSRLHRRRQVPPAGGPPPAADRCNGSDAGRVSSWLGVKAALFASAQGSLWRNVVFTNWFSIGVTR